MYARTFEREDERAAAPNHKILNVIFGMLRVHTYLGDRVILDESDYGKKKRILFFASTTE